TLALLLSGGGLLAYTALPSREPDPAFAGPKEMAEEQRNVALGPVDADLPLPADGEGLEAPLPPGAVVRLGSTRFRPGQVVGKLKLSPDGKKLISGGRASGGGISVWDATSGKLLLRRLLGEEGEISRDGERLFLIETLPPS